MSDRTTNATPAARPARRWLMPAFIASMALNLLIIGTAAGFAFRHKGGGHGARGGGNGLIGYVQRNLPAARRDELRPQFQEMRQSLRAQRQARRQAREAAVQMLTSEPFDKDRYAAALAAQLDAEVKVRQAAHKMFAEAASRLTLEERRAFVEWKQRRGRGRGGRWRDR